MPIVQTKRSIRPNTSVQFIKRSEHPLQVALKERTEALLGPETVLIDDGDHKKASLDNGNVVFEGFYDETGLVHTRIGTFSNLESFNKVETLVDIDSDFGYMEYARDNGITHPSTGQYELTGIDAPFTCTTTYTYNPATVFADYPLFDNFINVIESSDKLTSFTNTGTQLIAVHTYDNSADFTENHWADYHFVPGLHAAGVTRTIVYAMVS